MSKNCWMSGKVANSVDPDDLSVWIHTINTVPNAMPITGHPIKRVKYMTLSVKRMYYATESKSSNRFNPYLAEPGYALPLRTV